jgi:peroxiredoxin
MAQISLMDADRKMVVGLPPFSHYNSRVTQPLAPGQPAPTFSLTAVGSGRVFQPADHLGRPLLLLFVDHNTGRASQPIVETLRRRYADHRQLAIAVVVDVRIVPRLLRGMAEGMMESSYREVAAALPDGYDAADHLILLPDWSGDVVRAYGVGNVSREIALVFIGPDGQVRAGYHGPNPAAQALEMARALLDD